MGRLAEIKTEQQKIRPVRVMIYGIEGVGKSTFGARAPKPIFITPEGGTDEIRDRSGHRLQVIPRISTFADIREGIKELLTEKHDRETLVLDSADWIEKLAHAQIIAESANGKSIITAKGGYGAGYRESERLHRELIEDVSRLREERNMNIIVTAHYAVRTVKDPESSVDYEAFEIKCHEMVSSLWREWVDALLFCRFKTFVKPGNDSSGSRSMVLGNEERVMYTEKRPAFQAKNRYGLPYEINDVSWDLFYQARLKGHDADSVDGLKQEMETLFGKLKDETLKTKVVDAIAKAGFEIHMLIPIRDRLRELTKGVA